MSTSGRQREPDFVAPGVRLYLGDCREILPHLEGIDAVVSDPPWGISNDTDYTRFTNGLSDHNAHAPIAGDDKPFDPTPWLGFPAVVLWGANCFSDRLPMGTWLVWLKKRENQLGTFLSDCEVAWCKGGYGVYMHKHVWHGFDRETERGEVCHPNQKPVDLLRWCIERTKVPEGSTILDPYMGSCSTGKACLRMGMNFIGIEKQPQYFALAVRRIEAELARHPLFD